MRLIDVDAIPESATAISESGRLYIAWSAIVSAPTIEAEPIKHGRWERYYYSYFGQHQCVCSECKDSEYWKKYYCYGVESYCPNCGAKMDLEVEE